MWLTPRDVAEHVGGLGSQAYADVGDVDTTAFLQFPCSRSIGVFAL